MFIELLLQQQYLRGIPSFPAVRQPFSRKIEDNTVDNRSKCCAYVIKRVSSAAYATNETVEVDLAW